MCLHKLSFIIYIKGVKIYLCNYSQYLTISHYITYCFANLSRICIATYNFYTITRPSYDQVHGFQYPIKSLKRIISRIYK